MAELEMQEYEQLNQNEETTYDEIKVDKGTSELNHLVIQSWSQFVRNVLLILIVSLFAAGFVTTVAYFTVYAQLEQKLADINRQLAAIEKINQTKLHGTDNQENTNLDKHTMCYTGETWQRLNNSESCVCAAGFLGKQCEYSDGKDTIFIVVFHEGYQDSPPMPRILVASANTAHLSVLYFSNNTNQSITIDKSKTVYNLSNSVLPTNGIHLAGVELYSDVGINVYGFLYAHWGSELYLVMPIRFASTKYIIPTLPSFYGRGYNLLALTPIYQNTVVDINLKLKSGSITFQNKKYKNNGILRIVINKYNTLQLSHTSDLSGTMVTSSKPVIVVSGNQCNYAVPANIHAGYCQAFIESVLPTDQLDNMFITPYISTRLNNTIRIQAVNYTKVTIKNQYLYEYDVSVPTGFDSFVSITVSRENIDCFLLDGESFNITSVMRISDERIYFSTFSVPILDGVHHIEHSKKVRFGLWVYGNEFHEGYGYPAGIAYRIYN